MIFVSSGRCQTWSLNPREGHRLKAFKNIMVKVIVGPNREEAIGGLRKLHNEDIHSLRQMCIG
jgi:hypothetical protein